MKNTDALDPKVIQLYKGKPKGSENWDWSEQTTINPLFNSQDVSNIVQPTLLAYLPPKKLATGTAVIIAPPGGFHILSVINHGIEIAQWLNSKGIAAFVLKYRLVHSATNEPFKEMLTKDLSKKAAEIEALLPLVMADGLAAVKYVREHAKKMNIDPDKIGFLGFSAGGTIALLAACNATAESRPNFLAPIYASDASFIGSNIPQAETPIFVVGVSDDQLGLAPQSIEIYRKWLEAKQPAELHMYEKGRHGFSLQKQNLPVDGWINRFEDWLKMRGF